jgi:hypothetical protein
MPPRAKAQAVWDKRSLTHSPNLGPNAPHSFPNRVCVLLGSIRQAHTEYCTLYKCSLRARPSSTLRPPSSCTRRSYTFRRLISSGRCLNREEATQFGEKLRQRDVLHHVTDQYKFLDGSHLWVLACTACACARVVPPPQHPPSHPHTHAHVCTCTPVE